MKIEVETDFIFPKTVLFLSDAILTEIFPGCPLHMYEPWLMWKTWQQYNHAFDYGTNELTCGFVFIMN